MLEDLFKAVCVVLGAIIMVGSWIAFCMLLILGGSLFWTIVAGVVSFLSLVGFAYALIR